MYYEEKVIDGILHRRGTPDGDFEPFSLQQLTSILLNERESHAFALQQATSDVH